MKVKVIRMSLHDYNKLEGSWGIKARIKRMEVPSTLDGVKFMGCFLDDTHKEIAVAWPVDRPEVAQEEYSNVYKCGFPVDEFELSSGYNGKGH